MSQQPQSTPLLEPSLRGFFALLAGVSLVLTAGGALAKGVDFAWGVLLGSLIVGGNFFALQRYFGRALRQGTLSHNRRMRLAVQYASRFGLTLLVLYLAIAVLNADPLAIMVGVGAITLTALIYGLRAGKKTN